VATALETARRDRAPQLRAQLVPPALWDRTVAQFADVPPEQLHAFARVRWPKLTLEPILFWSGSEVLGGCLVMVQKLPLSARSLAMVKFGPVSADVEPQRASNTYGDIIDLLVADYVRARGFFLSIQPRASVGAFNPELDHLVHRGFIEAARRTSHERYFVNLRLTDEQQRASLDPKWRYHLEKSERAGLVFERTELPAFTRFLASSEKKRRAKVTSDGLDGVLLQALMATDSELLRPEVFFVRHLGQIAAVGAVFKTGRRAVYLAGASTSEAPALRANYFLQWNIVRWLGENTAAEWYDLGRPSGGRKPDTFRQGLVGDAGSVRPVPPAVNLSRGGWSSMMGKLALRRRELGD